MYRGKNVQSEPLLSGSERLRSSKKGCSWWAISCYEEHGWRGRTRSYIYETF